jgi:hypothetical protein
MAKATVHQMESKSESGRRAEEAFKQKPKEHGRIFLAEAYPHDAHTLLMNLIYLELSDDPIRRLSGLIQCQVFRSAAR